MEMSSLGGEWQLPRPPLPGPARSVPALRMIAVPVMLFWDKPWQFHPWLRRAGEQERLTLGTPRLPDGTVPGTSRFPREHPAGAVLPPPGDISGEK